MSDPKTVEAIAELAARVTALEEQAKPKYDTAFPPTPIGQTPVLPKLEEKKETAHGTRRGK